ncbi:hemolysin III [Propionigenium maris DSM 9537]|uniref:Hemolysin III n=1 Tax=Propionigenium maris DSM 9537 TaxID=1123000 RepID=A0A9W6GLN0_9FUSO|nr:hemolysin III family protein [Propionigenium maris]GLI56668.1 hemolysin III [Propionigenium maris DSM 9537]
MKKYSHMEEYLNSISHYLGAGMAVVGLGFLVMRAVRLGDINHVVSFTIFGSALILLYTMSGTYHLLYPGRTKDIFKILDHSAIYILISGSYTPYLLTVVEGRSAIILLVIQWGLTLAGIIFKLKFTGRFTLVSTLIYLFMGWMVMFIFKNLKMNLDPLSLKLLIASGITYTVGAVFYLMKNVRYTHVVWHLFVVGGSVLNYLSIYYSVS